MSEPAPVECWPPNLEASLRRYLAATPVPTSEHAGLLLGVALAFPRGASPDPEKALAVLIEGVKNWLDAHHRMPAAMPPIHRGPMRSPSLKPQAWKILWTSRSAAHPEDMPSAIQASTGSTHD